MTDLIGWLGQKVTERWLATLVLPGLAYAAAAAVAALAGHGRALDVSHLVGRLDGFYQDPAWSRPAAVVLVVAAGLAAATVAGLLAAATRVAVQRVLIADAPAWWRRKVQERTRQAWAGQSDPPSERYLPVRATTVGERFRLVGERVDAQYGLSVPDAWPCLWLLVGPDTRAVVEDAYQRYRTDTSMIAWALLYLPLALWWWPAAVVAVVGAAAGYHRARGSSATVAAVIEAIVDTHQATLATVTGVGIPEGRITPAEGNRINDILTRGARPDWLAHAYRPPWRR